MERSNITRKDLAAVINEKMGFSKRSAEELINAFFSYMKKSLIEGESVKLVHFGTLAVRNKSARVGRNPRTGTVMEISKRNMVSFKPSKGLREKINGN